MGATTCGAVAADRELALVAEIDPAFDEKAVQQEQGKTAEDGARRFLGLEEALAAGGIDVVVDFSVPSTVKGNILLCIKYGIRAVVGTTGLGADDLDEIGKKAAGVSPVLVAPNFALGAVLMMRFAEEAARHLRACEIVELHHEKKVDAPSGTARLTGERIEKSWTERGVDRPVPIHSVRLPGLVAHQEVVFGGLDETLTIRHDTLSRESFKPGVVLAAKRVGELQGLVVGLENVLDSE